MIFFTRNGVQPGDLGKLLGVTSQTIRAYCDGKDTSKRPAFVKTPDGTFRFHRSDLEAWLREGNSPNLTQLISKHRPVSDQPITRREA